MLVGIGFVVSSIMTEFIICMIGEEVPRGSCGSRSVDAESGIVWYPLAKKV